MAQLLNFSVQDLHRHRTAAVALLPVVLPAVYVVYLNWTVRRTTTCSSGQLNPSLSATSNNAPNTPRSLPEEVTANPHDWVVCYERVVSRPLSAASLAHKLLGHGRGGDDDDDDDEDAAAAPSPLLKAYLRTTYKAFSWTPQAFLIRGMLAEPDRRASFAAAHIDGLDFARGDVVDGVYAVTSYERQGKRGVEVIELSLDVPASYRGPPVRGLIMSAIEEEKEGAGRVVFVNETWLWRKKDEKPTLLETGVGKWFHSLLAGWLITKGLGGVRK